MRNVIWQGLLVLSMVVLMSAGMSTKSARGTGSYTWSDHHGEEGVATFHFKIEGAMTGATGVLEFGAEHRHGRPDFVITMINLQESSFGNGVVEFTGVGLLNNNHVHVDVHAEDRIGEADYFMLHARDHDGNELIHAEGELFNGSITIR